jgi:hypothetical protein
MQTYHKTVHGVAFTVRLYTQEEYLSELGGTVEGLLSAAEKEEAADLPFVGVAALDLPPYDPDADTIKAAFFDMSATEIAEQLLRLAPDDYALVPSQKEAFSPPESLGQMVEDETFLLKRWPRDAPPELVRELEKNP